MILILLLDLCAAQKGVVGELLRGEFVNFVLDIGVANSMAKLVVSGGSHFCSIVKGVGEDCSLDVSCVDAFEIELLTLVSVPNESLISSHRCIIGNVWSVVKQL